MRYVNLIFAAFMFGAIVRVNSQTLPTVFDLRNVNGTNYVTAVKSQQGGTCWTFGSMAAMEGNLMKTGLWNQSGEPDLAEYHLDWWNGFNQHNNDDYPGLTGNGLAVHNGGDYRVMAAYVTRGEGAVRETDAPSFGTASARFDTSYRFYYPRTIEWFTGGPSMERINTIKQTIIDHGVLGTCMCVGFWTGTNIHYQPPSSSAEPNHAVAIIGWNDTLQTTAHAPGAWLVKNSWGVNWGDSGYFWISYFDKHCGQEPQMGAVSFQEVESMRYKKIFFHDYHGWRDQLGNCQEAFNSYRNISDYQKIEAISFYNAADSIQFTASIYGGYKNGNLVNLLSEISGNISHTGFHTFDLDSVVNLSPNDSFFVYLHLSSGGQPYDRTSEVPVLLGAYYLNGPLIKSKSIMGQSLYRENGSQNWVDLTTYDSTANFCIKALANPLMPQSAMKPKGDTVVCFNGLFNQYYTPSVNFTDNYIWEILPATAGNILGQDTLIQLQWNPAFTGLATLKVTPSNSNGNGNSSSLKIHRLSPLQFSLGMDTAIKASHSIQLSTIQGFASYLWSDSSTNFLNTFVGNQLGIGNHNIWLEVTDSNGCVKRDSLVLTIENDASIFESGELSFEFYPNPATDFIVIQGKSTDKYLVVSVYNQMGKEVYSQQISVEGLEFEKLISLPDLSEGVYMIKVNSESFTKIKSLIIR